MLSIRVFFTAFFLAFGMTAFAQVSPQQVYTLWPTYQEAAITQRRFSPEKLQELLQPYATKKGWELRLAGRSVENRPISLLRFGRGPVKVLLWSQMHGDEPTATAALLDIFRFLSATDAEGKALRDLLQTQLSLYFVPMVNPDGAARFQRRNALEIDLNRDALALQSPESRLLKQLRDSLQADWGFNLHDQNRGYAAGPEGPPASITLLAPPLAATDSMNTVLRNAMQVCIQLYQDLQPLLPNAIGRWSDEFEARAFGENMQRWGTRTLLIESGGKEGDPERQEVRRLNFVAILGALQHIASGNYATADTAAYQQIPLNDKRWLDLLIKNVRARHGNYTYSTDLGIIRDESEIGKGGFYEEGEISEWGDLSTFKGYQTYDAQQLQLAPPRLYSYRFKHLSELSEEKVNEILQQGFTGIMVAQLPDSLEVSPYPLNLHVRAELPEALTVDEPADFLLLDGEKPKIAVINGFLYELGTEQLPSGHGRVIR